MIGGGESSRPSTSDDLADLAAIAAAHAIAIAEARGGALYLLTNAAEQAAFSSWFAECMANDRATALTGTYDDVPLGYCAARVSQLPDGTRLATIEALLVDPAAREVGIGEALMNAVVVWAKANGCRSIDASALPGDRSTKNFFESFGLKARLLTVNLDFGDY